MAFSMRLASALIVLACFGSPAKADILDGWCSQAKLPSSIALCSDPELRALAIERQHAFDAARARVGETRFPVLRADQNAWVASYPRSCGLAPDAPPPIPLPPQVRDCMASAGRTRIVYLNAYDSNVDQSSRPRLGATPPVPSGVATEVPLKDEGGTYRVPVRINDALTLNFTLDSGAADVLIPADVVSTLVRTETLTDNDFVGEQTYVLADGSKLPSARFTLRDLQVGAQRLTNVAASVGPVASSPLLGQSFLSRFKSWTLDNERHALVLIPSGQQSAQAPSLLSSPTDPFNQFPVAAIYRGPAAMPDFDGRDRQFRDFRTRIRDGISQGINFAGRYAVIQFGCGTECSFVLVADVSTGQVYDFPHGGEHDPMLSLDYRPSSNLISATWVPDIQKMDHCLREMYVFDQGRFTSLGEPAEVTCSR